MKGSIMRLCVNAGVALLLGLAMGLTALHGQTSQDIVGTVKDQSDAAIAGAKVLVRHLETNTTREVTTNEVGDYRVARLGQVGQYEVRAEMPGFKSAVAPQVLLEIGRTVRVDLTLQVGEITDSVTVETEVPLVRSETSSLATVLQNREILELPLNRRNFFALTALTPGVSTRGPAAGGHTFKGENLGVGGARTRDNDYRIDGIQTKTAFYNGLAVSPPLDSIQEFQLVRNSYAAEYGRAAGGIVELRTRSGTNQFHGSAYEFARRGRWNAIPYLSRNRPAFREDQYGGSIGGPVILPKLYEGKDRTFFFFTYERLYQPNETVLRFYTPTAEERRGDFSNSIFGTALNRPFTTVPYSGSIIPTNEINPVSLKVLKILPEPNTPLRGDVNWTANVPANQDSNVFVARLDHHFNDRHSVYGSLIRGASSRPTPGALDCGTCATRYSDSLFQSPSNGGQLGYTWLKNPGLILEVRGGFVRGYIQSTPATPIKTNLTKELGFGFFPTNPDSFGYPTLTVGASRWLREPVTQLNNHFSQNLLSTLSVNRGSHFLKFGFDVLRNETDFYFNNGVTGTYVLANSLSGNVIADFLLGTYYSGAFSPDSSPTNPKRLAYSSFIQDDWKLHPKLTLNLGLRHDYFGGWGDGFNRIVRFDFSKDEVIYPEALASAFSPDLKARILFPYRFEGPATSYQATKKNFGPRVGLAYRPFKSSHTVVRLGYGIFFAQPDGFETGRGAGFASPWAAFLVVDNSAAKNFTFDRADPEIVAGKFPDVGWTAIPAPGFRDTYLQQWNLTIQRQLWSQTALELGYVGSRGVRLTSQVGANHLAPVYGLPTYKNITVVTVNGHDSRYDSMQLLLQQRFSQGLSFRLNYTWSKALNDYADFFDNGTVYYGFDKRREWARAMGDHRHNLTLAGIYELPVGHRRRFLSSMHRVPDALFGGWKLNYIATLLSGFPINLTYAGPWRPNVVPGRDANLPASERRPDRWFDPTAFSVPAPPCPAPAIWNSTSQDVGRCMGSLARNAIDGPGFANLDLGISKLFRLKEGHSVEARLELFNATNHPNFFFNLTNRQGLFFNRANAQVANGVHGMRQLQVGIRYSF